jgi:hypothetical protein
MTPGLLFLRCANIRNCPQKEWPTNVRFGSKADIVNLSHHVRFTPNSGHEMAIRDLRSLSVALEQKMSALPQRRTFGPRLKMSALGQKRTFAAKMAYRTIGCAEAACLFADV